MAVPAAPQSFPYDHLFKILIIGDAGVGKVRFVSWNQATVFSLFSLSIQNSPFDNLHDTVIHAPPIH